MAYDDNQIGRFREEHVNTLTPATSPERALMVATALTHLIIYAHEGDDTARLHDAAFTAIELVQHLIAGPVPEDDAWHMRIDAQGANLAEEYKG